MNGFLIYIYFLRQDMEIYTIRYIDQVDLELSETCLSHLPSAEIKGMYHCARPGNRHLHLLSNCCSWTDTGCLLCCTFLNGQDALCTPMPGSYFGFNWVWSLVIDPKKRPSGVEVTTA